MNRTRRAFFIIMGLTVAGVAVILANSEQGLLGSGSLNPTTIMGIEPVHLTIASSVTKKKWLDAAAKEFVAQGIQTKSGKPIGIDITGELSGDSMLNLLNGELRPVVWSPGEDSWVAQFRDRWSEQRSRPAMAGPCKSTIYTPAGLAMWRPMAEALGWPGKKIGWKTIIDLAADPEGWARYGHPEWGKLKLGHTHPQYSSAGLLFLTSVIYGLTGQTSGLKAEQIYDQRVEHALSAIAKHTAKYGMVTTDLFKLMAQQGPDFLHVVAAFEEGVVRFNLEHGQELRWPLVFVFPSEGTFWSEHPYCILDGTDWVSPEQAEAARLFLNFVLAKEQQSNAVQYMLRPLDSKVPVASPLAMENGTDPSARPETVPAFQVPDAGTSAAIIDQFRATKRKATAMLVLDVSGSMNGEAIRAATEATAAFLKRLDPRDMVGLMVFNDSVSVVSDVQPAATVAEGLSERVLNLVSGGGTNLHGAVCAAANKMNDMRRADQASGENRLYGIILLSDGADTAGEISENKMFQTCLPAAVEAGGTKFFTIAFGEGAGQGVLSRIANVSGGTMFTANAVSIDQTYLKISAEQ
ncbi:MAG: VWA domain-containing protein [Aestuariivirga sp.]